MHRGSEQETGPQLVLRADKLQELRRAHDIVTDAALARKIGVDPVTLYRVTSGKVAPSSVFMARLKLAFPSVSLDALFELRSAS